MLGKLKPLLQIVIEVFYCLFLWISCILILRGELGDIDWLSDIEIYEEDNDYEEFYKEIDHVILGRKTYDQIVNELSIGDYPYKDKKSYIISSKSYEDTSDNIIFTRNTAKNIIKEIKSSFDGNIWIVGGSKTIKELVEEDIIDQYRICIMPFILGKGIPLFNDHDNFHKLSLDSSFNRNNMVYLRYSRI